VLTLSASSRTHANTVDSRIAESTVTGSPAAVPGTTMDPMLNRSRSWVGVHGQRQGIGQVFRRRAGFGLGLGLAGLGSSTSAAWLPHFGHACSSAG
jgi:hypothetical protein